MADYNRVEVSIRKFIKDYWMKEMADVVEKHPFMAFTMIGLGIEFLGKCLDWKTEMNADGMSRLHFAYAIHRLPALQKYIPWAKIPSLEQLKRNQVITDSVSDATFSSNRTFCTEQNTLYSSIMAFNSAHPQSPVVKPVNSDTVTEGISKIEQGIRKAELILEMNSNSDTNVNSARTAIDNMKASIALASPSSPSDIDLYSELRCGLAHSAIPGLHLSLSSSTYLPTRQSGDYTVFDAKSFFEEFKQACQDLLDLQDSDVDNRLNQTYMVIFEENKNEAFQKAEDFAGTSFTDYSLDQFGYHNSYSACNMPGQNMAPTPWYFPSDESHY